MTGNKGTPFLFPQAGETDEQRRLREELDRLATKFVHVVDSAIALRQAPADAQRLRHRMRGGIQDACLQAMQAHAITTNSPHKK